MGCDSLMLGRTCEVNSGFEASNTFDYFESQVTNGFYKNRF